MDYTPQQLMGHSCYHPRVRIGNWSEDLEIEEARLKFFAEQKKEGLLPSNLMKNKFDQHLQPTKLTPLRISDDENTVHSVHFGDRVMLFNQQTKSFLCVDLDTKLHHLRDRFGVTTREQKGPVARAVFMIGKPAKMHNDMDKLFLGESNVLHYGQSFVLSTIPEFGGPFYLRSQLVSHSTSSPISKLQEVSVDVANDNQSSWICEYMNPQYRVEYEGEVVRGNKPLLIKHNGTNQLLGSGANKMVYNDFGLEHEVYCKTMLNIRKMEEDNNVWCLVYAKPEGIKLPEST